MSNNWKQFNVHLDKDKIDIEFPAPPDDESGKKLLAMITSKGFTPAGPGRYVKKNPDEFWRSQCQKLVDKFKQDGAKLITAQIDINEQLQEQQALILSLKKEIEDLKKSDAIAIDKLNYASSRLNDLNLTLSQQGDRETQKSPKRKRKAT